MRILAFIGSILIAFAAFAQEADAPPAAKKDGPWFGVMLPPRFEQDPAVLVGARTPRPVTIAGPKPPAEFLAATLRKDLETIVGFSKESRAIKEIGTGQIWGRVSGLPSSQKTIDWAIAQFKNAGIADVKAQPIEQEARAALWLPLSWEVRLIGDPSFGPGTQDVRLESAIPRPPSMIQGEALTAPLIYVGTANRSVLDQFDVKGKIAVQLIVPQGHMVFERGAATSRAQEIMKRGAVAVLNLVRLPGNELAHDFSNCGTVCFNIGGRDGLFLENVLDRAAERGLQGKVQAQLKLKAETRSGLHAQNGVAVVPGKNPNEVIVIDAHADAWFDGAGDNADGLAVMISLARYFAKPEHRPARTLAFIASAGHHTSGINGPRSFVRANPDLAQKSVLVINIEHVAQRNFSPARSTADDGYRHAVADSGEAPIAFGVSNGARYLNELAQQGVTRFGVNFVSDESTMQSGETGGFGDIKAARITLMQAPPLYHTSGEITDVISTPGLERMARFLAYFVEQAAAAPRAQLNP